MRPTTTTALLLASLLAAFVVAVPAPYKPFQLKRGPSWFTYGAATHRQLAPSTPNFRSSLPNTVRQDAGTTGTPSNATTATAGSSFTFVPDNVPAGLELAPAFAEAKRIMDATWKSQQPVTVAVTFQELSGKHVLSSGDGVAYIRPTELGELLPVAAAEAILGTNLNGDDPEITVTMNIIDWYVGVDAAAVPTGQYDFITVLLHEIYHHLIFNGRLFVDVTYDNALKQTFRYSAKDEPTRFDKFMANAERCRILQYLDTEKVAPLKKDPKELVADSLTNGKLFFADEKFGPIAKLYSPRVWIPKSSAYHLDPENLKGENALMGPKIRPGQGIRSIGLVIQQIQNKFLNRNITGAPDCDTLTDPTPLNAPSADDRVASGAHGGDTGGVIAPPVPVGGGTPANERRIGGMKVWVFALVVTFSIIGGLLLIGLCIFLVMTCLRARKKNAESTEYEYDTHQEYDEEGNLIINDPESGEGDRLEGDSGVQDDGTTEKPESRLGAGAAGAAGLAGGALAGGALGAGTAGLNKGSDSKAGAPGGTEGGTLTDGADGSGGASGGKSSSKKSSKKKKSSSQGGTLSDDLGYGESGSGGKGGASVCPSSSRTRNRNNVAEPPSCAPRTFDLSGVPSASGHKAARRNGTPSKSSLKKSRSGKGTGSGGGSSGNGGSSLEYSDYYGTQGSRSKGGSASVSRSKSSKSIKKPGSVCPPTTCVESNAKGSGGGIGGKGSGGGGPFDCDTATMDPFDCETIFDCDTTSKKAATRFAVSEKPIPKLYNPSSPGKSRMLYLDSETTDSTHLRAYERGSAQKNPIAKAVKTPTAMKKKKPAALKPMSIAPTTTMASESTGFKVPSTKVPQRGDHTKSSHRSKHSKPSVVSTSIYNSTDCSCSECLEGTTYDINSCDYDYTMTSCKKSSAKGASTAPASVDFSGCSSEVPKVKKTCKSSAAKSSGGSTCKKSSSKKSIHSEGAKSAKSPGACKKSSSSKTKREDGKENECSNGKKSSAGSCKKSSSGKSVKTSGSSCKRSKSKESIKCPPPVALPPSCKPPSKGGSSEDYETAPTLPSSYYDSSVKPSSCPPSEEKKPEPAQLKSCCPSSEKKTATRYTSKSHRRRKSRDLTTDYTWSDTEETESRHRHHHKSTKVTTRHMTARYEDGKLVDKKMKEKKMSKKYKPTASTTTFDSETMPSSLYTSSYFMDTTKDSHGDKTSKHSRHSKHRHRDDKSLRRSRSDQNIQAVRYKSSGSTRHDDDYRKKHGTSELRRSRSDKDIGNSSRSRSHSRHRHHDDDETRARSRSRSHSRHRHRDDDETRARSRSRSHSRHRHRDDDETRSRSRSRSRSRRRHHDSDDDDATERRSSRSRSRSRSQHRHRSPSRHGNDTLKKSTSKKYVADVTMIPAVTPPTRRTDIHTVALDPEASRKYNEEKASRRSEKERRHRDKSRERRHRDHDSHRHDQTTVVTKKKVMKKETVVRRDS